MTQTYSVSGMTCSGCANTVRKTLEKISNVTDVQVDLTHGIASITTAQHVPIERLQVSLEGFPSYKISERPQ